MALTESTQFENGTKAPDFKLLNTVNSKFQELNELKGEKGTVILFICNHCPYVIHINEVLVKIANEYQLKGINFIAISSNDAMNYPQDGPKFMAKVAKELNYPFPYLYDETQEVAKDYDAVCTPDLYLFDSELKSVYHGQLDSSRPNSGVPVSGKDLRHAMDSLLEGKENESVVFPSIGCSIKWK